MTLSPDALVASIVTMVRCVLLRRTHRKPARAVGFALEAVVRPVRVLTGREFQEVCLLQDSRSGFGVLRS